jgi:pSer/pThr/pTyr-binding forkhead associated (FHA) protein
MAFFLKIIGAPSGDSLGLKIPLAEGESLAGRAGPPCGIVLDGAKVSKRHCLFRVRQGRLSVEDLDSVNGVYVNGSKVKQADLREKDRLVVGDFTLEVTVK